jgi:hypothetical protein
VLLDDPVVPAEQRSPPAGAGITLARAVSPDQHLARGGFRKVAWQWLGSPTRARGHGTAFNQSQNPESHGGLGGQVPRGHRAARV